MAMPESSIDPQEDKFAVVNAPIPLLYFNGFALQFGSADFTILAKVDNQPVTVLKMSYTVGKTLAEALTKLVSDFERVTNHDVMTVQDVRKAIKSERLNAPERTIKPAS